MEISFSNSFKKTFEKKVKGNKDLEEKFWTKISIFLINPFDSKLRTHKLSGKLKELWSFSIENDIRVIFFFTDNQTKAVFTDFGSHDEVY
jgi:mRNA-degrading endonuclease YafQ of YafQ-DinJ toxin-antitoxin module